VPYDGTPKVARESDWNRPDVLVCRSSASSQVDIRRAKAGKDDCAHPSRCPRVSVLLVREPADPDGDVHEVPFDGAGLGSPLLVL